MPVRRARHVWSAIERLESRGLLSSAASIRPDVVGLVAAAEIGSSTPTHAGDRIDTSDAGTRVSRGGSDPVAEPTAERSSRGGGAASRRTSFESMEARGLLEPLISFTHRTESTADGETTSSEPESSEVGSEAAFEPSIANSGLGWAPSAASLAIAMGMASDRGAGLGIRTTAGSGWTAADVVAAGSFGDVVPGTEVWPGEGHAESGPPAGDVDERTIAAVSDPAWADLLDGTLHADWETIDREICRFLSGIGGLTEHPGGWEVGRAWLAWMGAAAAMFLAHEGSHGARRFFRRAGRGAGGAAVEDPARVGPWPLGPP